MDLLKDQSLPNARDLGGFRVGCDLEVSYRQVFRSSAPIQPEHANAIELAGVRTVVDLRTDAERTGRPLVIPQSCKVTHLDILADEPDDAAVSLGQLAAGRPPKSPEGMNPAIMRQTMAAGYRTFVLLPGAQNRYATLLRELLDDGSTPTLVHCTAGKDRTGWAVALILLSLGVDYDDVMADYLESASQMSELFATARARASEHGGDLETLEMALTVLPEYLESAYNAMKSEYGSIDSYLVEGLNLERDYRDRLQERLLQPTESTMSTSPGKVVQ